MPFISVSTEEHWGLWSGEWISSLCVCVPGYVRVGILFALVVLVCTHVFDTVGMAVVFWSRNWRTRRVEPGTERKPAGYKSTGKSNFTLEWMLLPYPFALSLTRALGSILLFVCCKWTSSLLLEGRAEGVGCWRTTIPSQALHFLSTVFHSFIHSFLLFLLLRVYASSFSYAQDSSLPSPPLFFKPLHLNLWWQVSSISSI